MAIEILLWRGKRLDDLVKYRLDMAEERLNSSRILLDAGQYKDSIGGSYYANK